MRGTQPSMECIQSRAGNLLQHSIAGNASLTYNTAVNTFINFCLHYGLNLVWPAPDQHMILFIAFNFEQGLSPNTIKTYVAGLNFYHKLHGFAAISNTFLIQKLLEDCYRSRQTKDDRRPITRSVLLVVVNVLSKVCYNAYETKLFQALFKIAYFGLFRVSELVGTSVTSFSRQIQVQDVAVLPDLSAVTICMFRFKTNQRGSPVTLRIPKEGDSQLCPVRALPSFLLVRYCQPGPLFCHANGRPVTLQQFTAVLKKCIQFTTFNYKFYKSHSFRIGRATDLVAAGLPASVIMKMGCWSSDVYKGYIR